MSRPIGMAALALIAVNVSFVAAAPPKLDYLFPAGGQRGATVEVNAGGTFERWPVQAWVDSKSIDVKPAKTSGKLLIAVDKDAAPGVYWLRLHDDDGASALRPFIVGMLPEVLEKEPNDDPKKPHVLDTSSVVVNGRLDKVGDVDAFAVKLTKGQTLVASLEAYRTLRSPMDGVLQVLSSDGFVLERNDDYHSMDPQIALKAPKDDTYLVRVFAFPSVPDSSIRFAGKENFVYRLTLTTGPYVEYAYPLAVPRSAPGAVDLVGWNIRDELRKFPVKPRDGSDTLKLFHPKIANPFLVRLEPHAAVVKMTATRDEPQMVPLPVTITGRLDKAGDIDVYRFEAKKGLKLAIRIDAVTLGFPLDPVLRLTTATGKLITEARAKAIGADPALDTTITEDAVHGIEVRDLHGHGGMRHVYRLRIGTLTPDFELKLASDNFSLAPGKSIDIPVTVTRIGGFSQEITFTAEGLPDGVSASASAKAITLRAAIGKAPISSPIRIVGVAKDGTTRTARATVADLGRATEHLWLSLPRSK